jgi:hypothetical protein
MLSKISNALKGIQRTPESAVQLSLMANSIKSRLAVGTETEIVP